VKRGSTSLVLMYRKPVGVAVEDRILAADRFLGNGVALTSDGWMVTAAQNLTNVRLAEMTVWREGVSGTVQRGFIDRLSQTAFLKTSFTALPSAAFARIQDLVPGAAIWTEVDAGMYEPRAVVSVRGRNSATESVSSEFSARRILLNGDRSKVTFGSPLWDPNGSLVGLVVDGEAGDRMRAIPVTAIAASFNSFLQYGEVRHAALGVHAVDLAMTRIEGDRTGLPQAGAWLKDEKKTGKLAVVRDSAAAKAKLRAGDVIVRVDRDILEGSADLGELISEYKPESLVTLRIMRGVEDLDVPVLLGSVVTSEAIK